MQLPDFLFRPSPEVIRLTGHRIGLEHVVDYYNQGFSPEMLLDQFPSLPLALIHKVIAFYLENQAEADVYVAKCLAPSDAIPPISPDLVELRRRFQLLQHPELVR